MPSRVLLAATWTILILLLCLVPSAWLPETESSLSSSHFIVPTDKMVHLGMFAVLSFLWMRVRPDRGWTARVVIGGLAMAVLTEVGQGLPMIGRDPDTIDALADAAGVILGVGGYWAWRGLVMAPAPEGLGGAVTAES